MNLFTLIKNRVQVILFKYRLATLSWLSEKGILFYHHKRSFTSSFPIGLPKVYQHFSTYRVEGVTSYLEIRNINYNEDWFSRKNKPSGAKNASLIVSNAETEVIKIRFIVQINSFRFNPPNFDMPIWVNRANSTVRWVDDSDLHYSNLTMKEDDSGLQHCILTMREAHIDFDKYRLASSFQIPVSDYTDEEKNRILSATYRACIDNLANSCEEIQEKISGIKDNYFNVSPFFEVSKDTLCARCGAPIIIDKEGCRCLRCKGYFSIRHSVSKVEVYKAVDKYRKDLETLGRRNYHSF